MIEKILKDRLEIVEKYQEKLKKDSKKLNKLKKSEDSATVKRAVELNISIEEVLSFVETYKVELMGLLQEETITLDKYREKLAHYDEKFFEVLKFIHKKEELFKTSNL